MNFQKHLPSGGCVRADSPLLPALGRPCQGWGGRTHKPNSPCLAVAPFQQPLVLKWRVALFLPTGTPVPPHSPKHPDFNSNRMAQPKAGKLKAKGAQLKTQYIPRTSGRTQSGWPDQRSRGPPGAVLESQSLTPKGTAGEAPPAPRIPSQRSPVHQPLFRVSTCK